MTKPIRVCLYVLPLYGMLTAAVAQDTPMGRLNHVESNIRDELTGVTSVAVSPDGRFLYASAWRATAVHVFRRDPMSGKLDPIQTITDAENLNGATALRLSPNGRWAMATAFRSKTAVLFKRDPMSGKLEVSDVKREGKDGVEGLAWSMDSAFSADSKFAYITDSHGSGARDAAGDDLGSVTAFRITDRGKLEYVEANRGRENCFNNVRGIAVHPDGKTILVVSSTAGTLVVLDHDAKTGKVKIRQIVKDEVGGVHGLSGAMGVALSPDGQFAYTSAGRFRGDHAIGVYKFGKDGRLAVVQEFVNDVEGLKDFVGGNEIAVSPDGRNVYAVATVSGSVACYLRDSKTGKLKFVETLTDKNSSTTGAAGIGLSPDGRFVYVAAEESQRVSVFRRHQPKQAPRE